MGTLPPPCSRTGGRHGTGRSRSLSSQGAGGIETGLGGGGGGGFEETQSNTTNPNSGNGSGGREPWRTGPDLELQIHEANNSVKYLLERQVFPLGTFRPSEYERARKALDFYRTAKIARTESVNLALDLLDRLIEEMGASEDTEQFLWLCNPRNYLNPILNNWRQAVKRGYKDVYPPGNVLRRLQQASVTFPLFAMDIASFGMVLDAVLHRTHPKQAPHTAESILQFIRSESDRTNNAQLRPDAHIYCQILKAWANSGLPEAEARMESAWQKMLDTRVRPDAVPYAILLQFHARGGNVARCEALARTMVKHYVVPNVTNLAAMVLCYCRAGQPDRAMPILQDMFVTADRRIEFDCQELANSVLAVLVAYRRAANVWPPSKETLDRSMRGIEQVRKQLDDNSVYDIGARLRGTGTNVVFLVAAAVALLVVIVVGCLWWLDIE
jgi:hypothetical protein